MDKNDRTYLMPGGKAARLTVHYSFTLDAIEDADVVRWLGEAPSVSRLVRETVRNACRVQSARSKQ